MATMVSEKGQVVIPKAVRKALGIAAGTMVEFDLVQGEAKLRVVRRKTSRVEDGFGLLKYEGPPVTLDEMSGLEAASRAHRQGKSR